MIILLLILILQQNYELQIYDNQGKMVLVQQMTGTVKNIDVSGLQQGMYFLTVSDGKQLYVKSCKY